MNELIARIVAVLIFTLLPTVYLKYIKFKQEHFFSKIKSEIKKEFADLLQDIEKSFESVDTIIDEKREIIIKSFKMGKINKEKQIV